MLRVARFSQIMAAVVVALSLLSCTSSPNASGRAADYTVIGDQAIYDKKDTRIYVNNSASISLQDDGIHDTKNDAISTLQEPTQAMVEFPLDRRGNVNWVKAIANGTINPRMSLRGDEDMNIMDMDMIFKNTGEMPWVRFPHLAHTRWLDCSNCHPAIFIPQKGGNKLGMDAIIAGQYCGRCHDKVAFPLWTCERCHSLPQEGGKAAWWRPEDGPTPPTPEQVTALKSQGVKF